MTYAKIMNDPFLGNVARLLLKHRNDERLAAKDKAAWKKIQGALGNAKSVFSRSYCNGNYSVDLTALYRHSYIIETQYGYANTYAPNKEYLKTLLEKDGYKVKGIGRVK